MTLDRLHTMAPDTPLPVEGQFQPFVWYRPCRDALPERVTLQTVRYQREALAMAQHLATIYSARGCPVEGVGCYSHTGPILA